MDCTSKETSIFNSFDKLGKLVLLKQRSIDKLCDGSQPTDILDRMLVAVCRQFPYLHLSVHDEFLLAEIDYLVVSCA